MPLHHRFYILAACLLSQVCVASPLRIDPRGDSLYQQAVPYLQQADRKFEAVTAITPETSEAEEQRSLGLAAEGGALLKPAVQLLEQAAALGHPVAQYRLGLIRVMLLAPSEVIEEEACPLFEQSLAQGFAPPAVVISTWCLPHAKTPLYQTELQAVEAAMPGYEQYFPQPGVWLECKPEQPVGMALQWGSSRDYQAEVYRLLGDWNRAQRLAFYQKTVDLNDCAKARKRLRLLGN